MERIFSINSPKEHYHGATCVVWCFDDRFSGALAEYLKSGVSGSADVVEVAGGAKALAEEAGMNRDFVLNQIKLSAALHAADKLVLMVHMDCGGYGGSKAFAGLDAERAHHMDELAKAKAFIKKEVPALAVKTVLVDFDGIYAV